MTLLPTVLIVDDEPHIRSALMRLLAPEGYLMLTASNAEQAQLACRTHDVDLVISDERMPGLTGVQLMRLLRLQNPNQVRIILTGHPYQNSATDAIERAHVFRFLLKPWDDDELLRIVRQGIECRKAGTLEHSRLTHEELQRREILELERSYPGIAAVERDADGAIQLPTVENIGNRGPEHGDATNKG